MENDKRRKSINKTIHFLYDIEYVKHYNYYDELEAESCLNKSNNEEAKMVRNQDENSADENNGYDEDSFDDKENIHNSSNNFEDNDWETKGCSFSFIRVSFWIPFF